MTPEHHEQPPQVYESDTVYRTRRERKEQEQKEAERSTPTAFSPDIVTRLKETRAELVREILALDLMRREAKGGNLEEVYEGARDFLQAAHECVREALHALAPEEEIQ